MIDDGYCVILGVVCVAICAHFFVPTFKIGSNKSRLGPFNRSLELRNANTDEIYIL